MAYEIVPLEQASRQISPLMQKRMAEGKGLNSNFADNVRDSFPMLSIKGKNFRARISGEETVFLDPQTRQPLQFLDVILVNASPQLSKAYYIKGFTEGDFNPPDCWSLDSFKPDPSIANKMSVTCQACPMNAFGSRVTDNGKQAKACQDARRMAVVMPGHLDQDAQILLMLRVPQSSLKNLKAYVQQLDRFGIEPGGCVTRLAFDYNEAFPKLLFNFVAPLSDEHYTKVVELAEAPNTAAMLNAPDFENAPSTQPIPNASDDAMKGMAPQATPVFDNPALAAAAAQPIINQQQPVDIVKEMFKPKQETESPLDIFDLPDGRRFNRTTGEFIEADAAPEPELDPAVFALPTGEFFNSVTKLYVTGPYVGDPAVTVEEKKPAPAKKAAPKKEAAPKQEAPAKVAAAPAESKQEVVDKPQPNGATAAPKVTAAPSSLEDLLTKLTKPQTVS
jgi:hypothetical protein